MNTYVEWKDKSLTSDETLPSFITSKLECQSFWKHKWKKPTPLTQTYKALQDIPA